MKNILFFMPLFLMGNLWSMENQQIGTRYIPYYTDKTFGTRLILKSYGNNNQAQVTFNNFNQLDLQKAGFTLTAIKIKAPGNIIFIQVQPNQDMQKSFIKADKYASIPLEKMETSVDTVIDVWGNRLTLNKNFVENMSQLKQLNFNFNTLNIQQTKQEDASSQSTTTIPKKNPLTNVSPAPTNTQPWWTPIVSVFSIICSALAYPFKALYGLIFS